MLSRLETVIGWLLAMALSSKKIVWAEGGDVDSQGN